MNPYSCCRLSDQDSDCQSLWSWGDVLLPSAPFPSALSSYITNRAKCISTGKCWENDFNTKYGIPTIAINEDTPREDEFWGSHVHDVKNPRGTNSGTAQHIIATVEQFFKTPEGHFPRLAILVRDKHFQRRIKRVHVDEAHFIHFAGLARNGTKAFRPAWGQLDELKALLPNSIPWQAISATLPLHVLKTVEMKILRPNYISISMTLNRPNTVYATHRVVTSLDEARNYECFLSSPFNFESQPRVLIFFDNKALANNVARHLNAKLPPDLQDTGIIHHYHSGMSDRYLQIVHTAFTEVEGRCKILCATAGESVGVDFPDVKIVCNAGLAGDIVDTLQRGGRVGRRDGDKGLYVIFYEGWARDISLNEFDNGDPTDPDRTRKPLKPTSQKRDRASYSSVKLIKSSTCLREFFAMYLGDKSPNALDFHTEWCCDRHIHEVFDLQDFLPGNIFTSKSDKPSTNRRKRKTYRRLCDRAELDTRIISWLQSTSEQDPLRGVRATYDILSRRQRAKLVQAPAKSIRTTSKLTEILEETAAWRAEWADSLLEVVVTYDADLAVKNTANHKKSKTTL